MPASHSGLRRIYNRFNRLYFSNELPDLEIVWEPSDDSMATTHTYEGEPHRLTFDPALRGYRKIIKIVMLHEMIHVQYPKIGHGARFKAEIQRLWKLGAYEKLL